MSTQPASGAQLTSVSDGIIAAGPAGCSTATVRAPSCSSSTGAFSGSSIAPMACRTSGITSRNGAKNRAFISLSRPISSRTAS